MTAIIRQFLLVLAMLFVASAPASADVADKVFDFLKSKGSYVGIDPDGVEMSRYLYNYPENGSKVLAHAAEQDYPFFGLVGAVKTAKNKNFPDIGTFTEQTCLTPITAIDAVFGKADSMISNAGGKQETHDIVSGAENYAKDYALATTAQAKQEAKDELAKEIPYFGEIPLICHFGFHTDFQAEHDIQNLITERVKQAKTLYGLFKNGDIVEGTALLVKMGFSADMACDIVDSGLKGAGVGYIPGVSDLSNGLCKGFAGGVIGKAVDKGAAAVKDAACTVYDWFGGSCNSDVKVPPTGISNAKAFCAANGGLKAASSKTNAPDDYSVVCSNGMACRAVPGQTIRCTTLEQVAQMAADNAKLNETNFASGLKQYQDLFKKNNIEPCPDDQCKGAMGILMAGYSIELKKLHAQSPSDPVWVLEMKFIQDEKAQIASINAAAAARTQQLNLDKNSKATAEWQTFFVGKWSKECPDKSCVEGVQMIGVAYATEAKKLQAANPQMSFSEVQKQMTKKYAKMFQDYVEQQKKEALAADTSAAATDQLHAFDCKNFLGRADQYLCQKEGAFAACVVRVGKGEAKLCLFGDKSYGDMATVAALLGNQGCSKTKKGFACETGKGQAVCQRFVTGGMAFKCKVASAAPDDPSPAQSAPAAPPQQAGACKTFMGRDGQFLCASEAGFRACVESVRQQQADLCIFGDKSYGKPVKVIEFLGRVGCQSGGANGGAFTCSNERGRAACQRFQNAGMNVTCTIGG